MTKTKLSIKSNNRTHAGKEDALNEITKQEDFLDNLNVHNGRVDIHKILHRTLKSLGSNTTTDDEKTVTMRRLYTEALTDLFEKYEAGEGKYEFVDDHDWKWKK